MPNEDFHPSEQELLRYTDGELSSRKAGRIRAHLTACSECRTRAELIKATIADVIRAHRQSHEPKFDIAGPRALLKARLAELMKASGRGRRKQLSFAPDARGLMYVCALAILTVLGIAAFYRQATRQALGNRRAALARSLPDPSLTPGSTRPVTFAALCSSGSDDVVDAVPSSLRKKVLQEYGIQDAPAPDYEVDYLITPGLGGSDSIRNLWPEPHHSIVWNSYVKDQLEDRLHHMVCDGTLSLAEAQRGIASNWISAYKKYFHTDRPLSMPSPSRASGTRASLWPASPVPEIQSPSGLFFPRSAPGFEQMTGEQTTGL